MKLSYACFVFALAGCSSSVTSTPDTTPATDSRTTVDATAPLDVVTPVVDASPDQFTQVPDGGAGGTYTVQMPPVHLANGDETTRCVELLLGNDSALLITHIHVTLAPGSHHLIFYRSNASAPNATPTPCAPLGGVTGGSAPLFIAQATESDLVVPNGVGISIAAHQMVRVEEHFLNISGAPIDGTGTVTVDAVAPTTGMQVADLMFWGNAGINIHARAMPPDPSAIVEMFDYPTSGTQIFGLTAHEHHLGTLTQITEAASSTDTGTLLYSNTNWSEPPLVQFATPLSFPGTPGSPSTMGLKLHCEYNNTTNAPVVFGESAQSNEMCFFWAYYYPSHGFDVRF